MKTSNKGIELIKKYEGCKLEAYRCPAGVPTIGYGHTFGVCMGQKITQEKAEELLRKDLASFEVQVEQMAPGLSQAQFDALVSFSFNLGSAALYRSSLLKRYLAGDLEGAKLEFGKWTFAGGKVLPGLVARRRAEAELFGGANAT
jgi:lysozyme